MARATVTAPIARVATMADMADMAAITTGARAVAIRAAE
jgi:hypothetical protein